MSAEILAIFGSIENSDLGGRLRRLVEIFAIIHDRDLLSALPECPIARSDHLAALRLLMDVELELNALVSLFV